jgi:chromosome partitioning protein
MIVLSIVSQKGGAGKTTLAIQLAGVATSAGYVTCLIDTDPQATAAAWGDWRAGDDPEIITAPPTRLAKTLDDAAKLGAEVAVIDTPPHADAAARAAVQVADLVVIPCRPRAFDLHAIQTTADLASFASKRAFVVFTAAPPRATSLYADAREVVEKMGLQVAPLILADRAAYHHSAAVGKTALEYDPTGKAAEEVSALWKWVCKQVNMPARSRVNKQKAGAA